MSPSTTTKQKSKSSKPRVIYWFRTDLRLHDSPALKAALDLEPEVFYPIWTWDPHYVYYARVGPNRWQFLTDCQRDLSESLTKLNKKQKLHLIREAPQTLLPKLFKLWDITHLVFEKDTDAYARDRDEQVKKLAEEAGVQVIVKVGRTLYDPDELVKRNGGKPTMSMNQVLNAAKGLGDPARPIPAPKSLPDPGPTDLSSLKHQKPKSSPDVNAPHRKASEKENQYESIMGPKNDFAVPTLQEMGIPEATTPHRGGETLALEMLDKIIKNSDYTGTFEKPKSAPTDFAPASTTLLSPHHHFGSLSIREFYWRVEDVYRERRKAKKPVSKIPENLHGQVLFRDMYFGAQAGLGYSFAQEVGNPVCRFIDWHLRSETSETPIGEHLLTGNYVVDDLDADEWFRRWKSGTTGFPWIDALMRQLRTEGWIHHLGRHAVACFLTRGGCYIHWERGAEVFEEYLIDHETACNAGNWMWLSCTAFFSQFFRCYSPIAFPKKTDAKGDFVRRYVPELKNYDKKYIYEPWTAPIADQKKWGCIIKGDGSGDVEDDGKGHKIYPKPMFDFNERRKICLDKMKAAYGEGLHGDDAKVRDGSWMEIFDYKVQGKRKRAGQDLPDHEVAAEEEVVPEEEEDGKPAGKKKAVKSSKKQKGSEDEVGDKDEDKEEEIKEERSSKKTSARGTPSKRGRKQQVTLDSHVKRK